MIAVALKMGFLLRQLSDLLLQNCLLLKKFFLKLLFIPESAHTALTFTLQLVKFRV